MNVKPIVTRIICYSCIVLIIVPIIAWIDSARRAQKPNLYSIPLGNILSEYFYFVNTNIHDHNLVTKNLLDSVNIADPELANFYANLDWTPRQDLINFYDSNGDSTWHSINLNRTSRKNYLQYWQSIRTQVADFYKSKLPFITVNYPIVHLRCSDVPFIRHPQYHLPKASSVTWIAQELRKRGYKDIVFLNCHKHRLIDKTACQQFSDFYMQTFKNAGLQVHPYCSSILHDFSIMVYSPILVSLNSSSYAFMAGIAKNPENYISCNFGMEIDGTYTLQTAGDWLFDTRQPLLHSEVVDYNDTAQILIQLNDI